MALVLALLNPSGVQRTNEQTNSRQAKSSADVAILLGGIVRGVNDAGEPDLNDSVDRAVKGVRLYRGRSGKRILVTGLTPEPQLLASLSEEWGVPKDAILIEDRSRNTFENAVNSNLLWDTHYDPTKQITDRILEEQSR
jgi:uncharacterized SAM-binding protein YcdF (DUF218 family)